MTFWELSLDGWVGAVVGAAASVGVAVWVLLRTLRHEREMFVDQLEKERELAVESSRTAAFANLCSELLAIVDRLGDNPRSVFTATAPTLAAWHAWAMYMPAGEDEFARGVNRGIATIREKAEEAVMAAGKKGRSAVELCFDVAGGSEDISWLVGKGRKWHLEPEARDDLERRIVQRFPRRTSVDADTGETFFV